MKRLVAAILILIVVVGGGTLAWEFAYDDYVKQAQEAEEKARSLNKWPEATGRITRITDEP